MSSSMGSRLNTRAPQMEVLSGEVTELSRHSIYLTDIGPQWVDFETVSADTGKLVGRQR